MEKKQNVPVLRFQGFSSEWEVYHLGDLGNLKNGMNFEKEAMGKGYPFVNLQNIFGRNVIEEGNLGKAMASASQLSDYDLKAGDVLFVRSSVKLEGVGESAVVCKDLPNTTYSGFIIRFRDEVGIDNNFKRFVFSVNNVRKQIISQATNSANKNISQSVLSSLKLSLPDKKEQERIGAFFVNLDGMIAAFRNKIQKLQQFRQAMLMKFFPREGAAEPELRFRGFSDKWRMEKFSKLVFIERGGSPRPIDSYITNAEDGLNWVKIGDAPKYGIYITHTAEKIKPAGLSMTRQVYPGDLILSNSMSFGRPYIMTITGCIHDGWLLIRNSNKIFDLKFLYCLLGSPNVLKQYKALAAGSAVNNLNKALVGSVIIQYPSMEEQKQIGKFFDQLDSFISLQQKKLERMQRLKGALLEKMFV